MFTTFAPMDENLEIKKCDVLIAGSGPIGATFARTILKEYPTAKVCMVEIGAQDSPTVGAHHKNAVKFQKDIDAFVHIIQGALQPISVPPADTFMSTLGEVAWVPPPGKHIIQSSHNPLQKAEENLKSFVTRTVGGMATHWTCACPFPHEEEHEKSPVPKDDLKKLLEEAKLLLDVNLDQYDDSIRHTIVKNALVKVYGDSISNLPLAVRRNENNREFVTWSGVDTILKDRDTNTTFKPELITETRVTRLIADKNTPSKVKACQVRDLMNNVDYYIEAKQYVIACGAVGTPQVLWNSGIRPEALGRYLAEQSLTFCQIVLKKSIIATIPTLHEKTQGGKGKTKAELSKEHVDQHKKDTLPIPFNDPEPQVTIKYTHDKPWHVQIHRDAFAYGGVGPRADPRTVVDLRFFGRQEIRKENRVYFDDSETKAEATKDGYGMPQATFEVTRTAKDAENDHRMMNEMCNVASVLGAYLPGSEPQFMEPGLVLHITGTTRLGTYDKKAESVADSYSKVHDIDNLYVGGNGVIPDSTACNPTLTSVAYALRAARSLGAKLDLPKAQAA